MIGKEQQKGSTMQELNLSYVSRCLCGSEKMKESTSILTKNFSEKEIALKELQIIPGIGKSIANDLYNIGIRKVSDLKRKNPEKLFELSNQQVGVTHDRCLLYVFRCAVYFAETSKPDKEKLNWWWWKDKI